MKKFLNYILVAGVAVSAFVGGVAALGSVDEKVANAVNEKYDNKNLSIKVLNTVDDAEVIKKAADDAIKGLSVENGYVLSANTVTSNVNVTIDLAKKATSSDENDTAYDPNPVATMNLVFVAKDLKPEVLTSISDFAAKAKDIALTDMELIQWAVNGSKNAAKYSSEFKKLVATTDGKLSYTYEEGATDNAYVVYTKYDGNYAFEDKAVAIAAATGDDLVFTVPNGTTDEQAEKVITDMIKAVAGDAKVEVTYTAADQTATVKITKNDTAKTVLLNTTTFNVKEGEVNNTTSSEITSNSTDVTATADKAVDAGTKLVVEKIANPAALAKAVAKDVKDVVAYTIKLVDADNEEVKFDGVKYTVTVTIPENLKGKDLAAYTIVDGKLEEHKITVNGDKGTFTTTHFSDWVITEVVKIGEDGKVLPNTLDNAASFAFVGVIGLVGMAASALFLNKRN